MENIKVEKLSSMIDFQEDSVVSRTLIDKEAGTITLFAFDDGEGLSEHTAPYDALVQILDGEAVVEISGEIYNLEAGEMIIMPANDPHALRAEKKIQNDVSYDKRIGVFSWYF